MIPSQTQSNTPTPATEPNKAQPGVGPQTEAEKKALADKAKADSKS